MKIALILLYLTQLCLINTIYGSQWSIKLKNGGYSNVIVKLDVNEAVALTFMPQLKVSLLL